MFIVAVGSGFLIDGAWSASVMVERVVVEELDQQYIGDRVLLVRL